MICARGNGTHPEWQAMGFLYAKTTCTELYALLAISPSGKKHEK